MNNKFALRERKKAQLRLDLVDELVKMLRKMPFEEINVKVLCDKVNISEVTFFKYFKKKEELLQFFMLIWNYKRELRLKDSKALIGKDAIYQLFDDIAKTENAQWIMNTLISYNCRLQKPPKQIVLSDCEKWLISPDDYLKNYESLNETLLRGINQAIKIGELSDDISVEKYFILLGSIYYGTPVLSHVTRQELYKYYKDNLDIIFMG